MKSWLKASSAVAIVLACGSAGAQQADRAQTEALARRAALRLSTLHDEADRLASEERTLLGDLRRLEVEREIKAEELHQVEREAAQVAADLSALDAQVAALEHQEQTDAPRLQARLVSLYKLGQGRYVRLLLSASEVQRIGQASRIVAALAGQDRDRVAIHQRRLEELSRSRATFEERRGRLVTLRADAGRAKSEADRAVVARNERIRDIDERRDLNAQLSGELISAQQQLQATLSGLARGTTTAAPSVLPIAPFRGDLAWPVTGNLRQAFGRSARGGATASNGIDIAAAEGVTVQAVHDGTVAFAGTFAGFGQLVIVDHGGQTFSLYGNLQDTSVAKGARIERGEPIGTVGIAATGAAGLYFELRIDGRPADPVQWLRKR
jgi:septal ring factor EnvC (AmiA/AmiB activator)